MIDPRAAYRAAGRQAVEEAFHRFLIELGVQPQIRVRLVAELRELDGANPALSHAWVINAAGPDGRPHAKITSEPPDPAARLFDLPIGKWKRAYADLLRAELATERSGTAH